MRRLTAKEKKGLKIIGLIIIGIAVFLFISGYFKLNPSIKNLSVPPNAYHSSGYVYVDEYITTLTSQWDRECWDPATNEQIEVVIENASTGWNFPVISRFLVTNGPLSTCYENSYTHPVRVKAINYVNPNLIVIGEHKTKGYTCINGDWNYYGYFDEGYGKSLGGYWCSDIKDNAYKDADGIFHCATSTQSSWCGSSRKDAQTCFNKGGTVFYNCGDQDRPFLFKLDSGANSGMSCCGEIQILPIIKKTYYRFLNNQCFQIKLQESEKTINDFISSKDCENRKDGDVGDGDGDVGDGDGDVGDGDGDVGDGDGDVGEFDYKILLIIAGLSLLFYVILNELFNKNKSKRRSKK